jgi:hypothetical protein
MCIATPDAPCVRHARTQHPAAPRSTRRLPRHRGRQQRLRRVDPDVCKLAHGADALDGCRLRRVQHAPGKQALPHARGPSAARPRGRGEHSSSCSCCAPGSRARATCRRRPPRRTPRRRCAAAAGQPAGRPSPRRGRSPTRTRLRATPRQSLFCAQRHPHCSPNACPRCARARGRHSVAPAAARCCCSAPPTQRAAHCVRTHSPCALEPAAPACGACLPGFSACAKRERAGKPAEEAGSSGPDGWMVTTLTCARALRCRRDATCHVRAAWSAHITAPAPSSHLAAVCAC